MAHETEWLTPKEYAQLLRVHVKTVLRWIRKNEIPGVRIIGGTVRIPSSASKK